MIRIIIFLLLLLIFNLCFFVICPVEVMSGATWITFVFMNLAIILPLVISFLPTKKSEVRASVLLIATIYSFLEVIAGVILLICGVESVKWCFVGQLIPLLIVLAMCLAQYSLDRK